LSAGRAPAAIVATLLAATAAGCAAMTYEDAVPVTGASARTEAYVTPEGGGECRTPCRIELGTLRETFELRVRAPGFQPGRVVVRHEGSEWVGEITSLGSTPCLAIDLGEGVVRRAQFTDLLEVDPVAVSGLPAPVTGQLTVATVTRARSEWPVVTVLARE